MLWKGLDWLYRFTLVGFTFLLIRLLLLCFNSKWTWVSRFGVPSGFSFSVCSRAEGLGISDKAFYGTDDFSVTQPIVSKHRRKPTYHHHLLLLPIPKAGTHFTFPWRVNWIDLGTTVRVWLILAYCHFRVLASVGWQSLMVASWSSHWVIVKGCGSVGEFLGKPAPERLNHSGF